MSTPEKPDIAEDAYRLLMQGRWEKLGITGGWETALGQRIRRYVDQGRTVPSHLLYQAREVWDAHRDEILECLAWEQADLYTECRTCPNCGCPGMN